MRSNKIYKKAGLVWIVLPVIFLCCRSDRSKSGYHTTFRLCGGRFFVETFTIFGGGAGGGDRVSSYITDSVNFRKYLGTYINDAESIATVCKGDSVCIYRKKINETTQKFTIVNLSVFSVRDLKNSKTFD